MLCQWLNHRHLLQVTVQIDWNTSWVIRKLL